VRVEFHHALAQHDENSRRKKLKQDEAAEKQSLEAATVVLRGSVDADETAVSKKLKVDLASLEDEGDLIDFVDSSSGDE
jgi:hypothetical protein